MNPKFINGSGSSNTRNFGSERVPVPDLWRWVKKGGRIWKCGIKYGLRTEILSLFFLTEWSFLWCKSVCSAWIELNISVGVDTQWLCCYSPPPSRSLFEFKFSLLAVPTYFSDKELWFCNHRRTLGWGTPIAQLGAGIPASITQVRYRTKKMPNCVGLGRDRTGSGIYCN